MDQSAAKTFEGLIRLGGPKFTQALFFYRAGQYEAFMATTPNHFFFSNGYTRALCEFLVATCQPEEAVSKSLHSAAFGSLLKMLDATDWDLFPIARSLVETFGYIMARSRLYFFTSVEHVEFPAVPDDVKQEILGVNLTELGLAALKVCESLVRCVNEKQDAGTWVSDKNPECAREWWSRMEELQPKEACWTKKRPRSPSDANSANK
ncbi:hypothetical protein LZ554_003404 [Drepanopeziza brunnea f. sp. 'monogermtubi']|nr:hypothetical protein LZ554_003404 [Drepanopeziza brunnea f. sp. 'monogermtubi']